MSLIKLEWDSEFFKLNIARVSIQDVNSQIDSILSNIYKSDFDLIYFFSKSYSKKLNNLCSINDTKLIYRKENLSALKIHTNVISYHGEMNDNLIDLALESGIKSRFKLDKNLTSFYSKLYTIWLEKSLNRIIADEVYVYKDSNGLHGFITLTKDSSDTAKIGLIAVNPSKQRKGIGKCLINAAEYWARKNHLKYLQVPTQAKNKKACIFYENIGFKLYDKDYIFHIWVKNRNSNYS